MAVFCHLKYSQNEIQYMSYYPVILWVYGGERGGLMNKLFSGNLGCRTVHETLHIFHFVDFSACEMT